MRGAAIGNLFIEIYFAVYFTVPAPLFTFDIHERYLTVLTREISAHRAQKI